MPRMLNLEVGRGSVNSLNWGWFFLRFTILLTILTTLFLSQRFWYRSIWRLTANWATVWLRVVIRLVYVVALLLIIAATADSFYMGRHGHLVPRGNLITVLAGLWVFSALLAYFALKFVRALDLLWTWARKGLRPHSAAARPNADHPALARSHASLSTPSTLAPAAAEVVPDPSRRYFFRAASALEIGRASC